MLKRLFIAGVGALALAGLAAAAQPSLSAKPDAPRGQAEAVARLFLNEDVKVDSGGVRVRLRMVDIRDSRCPTPAACIVAGEAVVTVNAAPLAPGQASKAATVTLHLPGTPQVVAGVTLTLRAVDPHPTTTQPRPSPQEVVATVGVAKGD